MSPCFLPLPLQTPLQKKKKNKFKSKINQSNKQQQQQTFDVQGIVWSSDPHSVAFSPYIFTCVCCNEALVWLEDSSFCYTIDNGLSLGLLSDILLLLCVMEIL